MNAGVAWARHLVGGLASAGLSLVVVCPGSRSTPLALAAHQHPDLEVLVAHDERSAGFFAVGWARANGRAAAVITTSGTAAVNLHPSIVEASYAAVPLIALTADRPPELQDVGANQTIDQRDLYTSAPRWFHDPGVPYLGSGWRSKVAALAARAWRHAHGARPGPVHVNLPFREPLLGEGDEEWPSRPPPGVSAGAVVEPDPDAVASLADDLVDASRGLIIVGPRSQEDGAHFAVWDLARHLDAPILADPLSGMRYGAPRDVTTSAHYDAWISSLPELDVDWVIQFGAMPTSKDLVEWIGATSASRTVVHDPGFVPDEPGNARRTITAGVEAFCTALMGRMAYHPASDAYLKPHVEAMDEAARDVFSREPPWEGSVLGIAMDCLSSDEDMLVVGNSLPVRDLDRYGGGHDHRVRVIGNRGASGIDGQLAMAAGAARGANGRTIVVVGDVSAQHDIGSLDLVARYAPDLRVVIIDNGGGGIFSTLPVREQPGFSHLFLTPTRVDWDAAAAAFGLKTTTVGPPGLAKALAGPPGVVVVKVDLEESLQIRQRLAQGVAEAVPEATRP